MTVQVGIDFGTSTTLIAVRSGELEPSITVIGEKGLTAWMPSVVAISPTNDLLVGESAARADNPIRSIKSKLTQNIFSSTDSDASTKEYIEEILYEAMCRAIDSVPEIGSAVDFYIGCPAEWDGNQRRAIADAANSLGINIDIAEVIDEPVAAGLSWVESSWLSGDNPTGLVVVFDAGGGTLDVAILHVEHGTGSEHKMTVLSAGSLAKSGDAVDKTLAIYIASQVGWSKEDGYEPENDYFLLESCRTIKEGLSTQNELTIRVRSLLGEADFSLDDSTFRALIKDQLEQSLSLVDRQLRSSRLRGKNPIERKELSQLVLSELCDSVAHVLLVGGLSQSPAFAEGLKGLIPRANHHVLPNPQELVARGLTFGSNLQSLNLPRPPVNFVISGGDIKETVYQAFTPLYTLPQWFDGKLQKNISLPKFVAKFDSYPTCESPTRDGRKLEMVVAIKHDQGSDPVPHWLDVWGPDWRVINDFELPSDIDFLAIVDQRSNQMVEPDPYTGFVDAVNKWRGETGFKTTILVGNRISLKGATDEGQLHIGVDGTILLNTSKVGTPGQKSLTMKVLFWPLRSGGRRDVEKHNTFTRIDSKADSDSVESFPEEEALEESISPVNETELALDVVSEENENLLTDDFGGDYLGRCSRALATILIDYGLTPEEINEEIDAAVNGGVFMVTEDDVPKVIYVRFVEGELTTRQQADSISEMVYETEKIATRKSIRGLKDQLLRDRYEQIKVVRKLDPEFQFHLVCLDVSTSNLFDVQDFSHEWLRGGIDTLKIHSEESLILDADAYAQPKSLDVTFSSGSSLLFEHTNGSGYKVVSVLLPASQYVESTYPLGVELFGLNPRLFLSKSAGPNKAMKLTLESEEAEKFHLLNNGITGVCRSLSVVNDGNSTMVTATNLQIVNGCQTTETIWAWARTAADTSKVMIPIRLIEAGDDAELARRISMTTNAQSAIAAADLVANDSLQKNLKEALSEFSIFYEARRGELRKISSADRTRLGRHQYGWNTGITNIGLREMGQALLAVSGRPNQAKEQIAGLFKDQNRGRYVEVFGDSWEASSQPALVALLFLYLKDLNRWLNNSVLKERRVLAGLGRFYVTYLIYEYWRKGSHAFIGDESVRADGQDVLIDSKESARRIANFDEAEIKKLANLAVSAMSYVLKNSNPAIDGNRALLRQGIHRKNIEDRFLLLINASADL